MTIFIFLTGHCRAEVFRTLAPRSSEKLALRGVKGLNIQKMIRSPLRIQF
jgi:hypothetical protein